jgi:hypothetical protein
LTTAQLLVSTATLLFALDLIGTFRVCPERRDLGCQEQARRLRRRRPGVSTGNAGGVTRDLLIARCRRRRFHDWRYVAVSLVAGRRDVRVVSKRQAAAADRAAVRCRGSGLFAVAGTQKALAVGLIRSCRRCSAC